MAPSISSTTTSVPEVPKLQKTIRLNAKAADEHVRDASTSDLQRDPIEVKYRDFFWSYTEEPHRSRRLAIIKAHPEVRENLVSFSRPCHSQTR